MHLPSGLIATFAAVSLEMLVQVAVWISQLCLKTLEGLEVADESEVEVKPW